MPPGCRPHQASHSCLPSTPLRGLQVGKGLQHWSHSAVCLRSQAKRWRRGTGEARAPHRPAEEMNGSSLGSRIHMRSSHGPHMAPAGRRKTRGDTKWGEGGDAGSASPRAGGQHYRRGSASSTGRGAHGQASGARQQRAAGRVQTGERGLRRYAWKAVEQTGARRGCRVGVQ